MSLILIIETSTEICSVSLVSNGKQTGIRETVEGNDHARQASVFASELLSSNNLSVNELSAVAVSRGPGSYTGLRIGTSLAKGICHAAGIPLIAVGTLEAMTSHVALNLDKYGLSKSCNIMFCPMIDARRMEVYSMLFDSNCNIIKPITAEIIDEDFLKKELPNNTVVFFGNGSAKCQKVIKSNNAVFVPHVNASAQFMTELVYDAYNNKQFENVAYFEPFYLKDFVATVSKKNILV